VDDFEKTNLFYPDIAQKLSFTTVNNIFSTNTGYFLRTDSLFILSVLNSKLINYYFKTISSQLGETGIRSFTIFIEQIPVKKISIQSQQPFIEKADLMLSLNKGFQEKSKQFLDFIQSKFGEGKISNKLEKWYELQFQDFVKEIEKYRKSATAAPKEHAPLTISEQAEWMDFLTKTRKKP
jgi:hypothetical protein